MTDYPRDSLDLDEEDRLPWLEPADDADGADGVSPLKLLGFVIVGLMLLGAVVGGVYWFQNRGNGGVAGEGRLIAAPEGDYKVPANQTDAKTFAGTGDASYAASEGVERDGRIDPSRVPEAPVTSGAAPAKAGTPAAAKIAAAKPSARMNAAVIDGTKAAAKPATASGTKGGGAMIQLGAYGSQGSAKDAWGRLSKRFAYLEPLAMSVEQADVGGTTLYRLRAGAGSFSQANALCGKLKVAGESCLVVN
jgi:hypothetical protein